MKPHSAIRWTLETAAREFEIAPRTLSKRITSSGIVGGDDLKFSTKQICAAVFGDMDGEKLRETRHRANLLEIEEKEKRQELVAAAAVEKVWRSYLVAVRQHVKNHQRIPDDLKSEILLELREIPKGEFFKDAVKEEAE